MSRDVFFAVLIYPYKTVTTGDFMNKVEALQFAQKVLQKKLDKINIPEPVIPEDASQYCDKNLTKKLFHFFKGYGYWLINVTEKNKLPKELTKLATFILQYEAVTRPFITSLLQCKDGSIEIPLSEKHEEQTAVLNLCKALENLTWIKHGYDNKTRKLTVTIQKEFKPSGRQFLRSTYGEYETIKRVEGTLQKYATEHNGFKYKLFHSIEIRKFDSLNHNDMELDVIAELPNDGFYIFETKMGETLAIDKWVDRARLFSREKVRFITCGRDNNLNPKIFHPYSFFHMDTLQNDLLQLLQKDYPYWRH